MNLTTPSITKLISILGSDRGIRLHDQLERGASVSTTRSSKPTEELPIMSKISRRLGSGAAAVALAAGLGLASATPAHAYDLVTHYSADQAREYTNGIQIGVLGCGAFPWYVGMACSLSANAGVSGQIQYAASKGCGLDVYVTATGSGMSYDKAEYDYALVC